ncbi:hypothetical protein N7G274_004818 [Stereocaulon virgatum]|uniref:Uncharacterized protein n=1 Tax=Stereocaulon virgatum TaxID=373712 RepID=A0ABR4A8W3_9LECA
MSRREYISADCGCRFIVCDGGFSALTAASVQSTGVTTTNVDDLGPSNQAGTTASGSSVIATSERLDDIDTRPGSPAEVTDVLDRINLLLSGLALIHQ